MRRPPARFSRGSFQKRPLSSEATVSKKKTTDNKGSLLVIPNVIFSDKLAGTVRNLKERRRASQQEKSLKKWKTCSHSKLCQQNKNVTYKLVGRPSRLKLFFFYSSQTLRNTGECTSAKVHASHYIIMYGTEMFGISCYMAVDTIIALGGPACATWAANFLPASCEYCAPCTRIIKHRTSIRTFYF